MRKFLSIMLTLALVLSLGMSVASAEGYSGDVKIWVADNMVELTKAKAEEFKAAHPEYKDMNVLVEAVGEGDSASNMITDVEGGADIYGFAQDQLARLVAAGALVELSDENAAIVKEENDGGSVAAVTLGEKLYAYPMTSDNGYFMYYDKSVITDPSTLEGVLKQAEEAGKKVYFEINSGWYQTAFFFGTGAFVTYDVDDEGNLVKCNINYASPEGLDAIKGMIALAKSPAFVNGSSASNASDYAAIVDGTWDAQPVKDALGDNYAAAKLPTFTVGEKTYQLSGFGGFKMLGVKPQVDEAKLAACDALALFLTSYDVQAARFEQFGWGPSNLKAQQLDAVKEDIALSALAAQLNFSIGQGQYPNDYWSTATGLGDDIIAGKLDDMTDEQLMERLTAFQDILISLVK
ncbi:MAG TPA: extracellular solute-binding protein [Clostridiales bacterium]|nr:extracellular solute-binding protein [Clostridiales bacterium]